MIFKKGFVFFLQKILFFFWFGVKYEHSFFFCEINPTGPEVLAQLLQMFWHTDRCFIGNLH